MVHQQCNDFEHRCPHLRKENKRRRGKGTKKKEKQSRATQDPRILLSSNDVIQYLISGDKKAFFSPFSKKANSTLTKPCI